MSHVDRHDLVVIGASQGGLEVLTEIVAHLPADLGAAVCIVLHVAPAFSSMLPDILSRRGPCANPPRSTDRDPAVRFYVSPPATTS